MKFIIGIDEAGRGPLAGPVSVGAVIAPHDFDWSLVEGAKDSKKMTPLSRDRLYEKMRALRHEKRFNFAVAFSSATLIDQYGIVPAIKSALDRALTKIQEATPLGFSERGESLFNCEDVEVLLDGGLYAPPEYLHQRTIIRGDDSEAIISLASIAAKVERDRLMTHLAEKYPLYKFDVHKGYGTAAHSALIREHGLSPIHRRSFCTALISERESV